MSFDHQYIEEHHIAERYLRRTLPAADRAHFEEHFPDCPECLDRLALAEVFRGTVGEPVSGTVAREEESLPRIALRRLAELSMMQRRIVVTLAVLVFVGSPVAFVAGVYFGLQQVRTEEQQSRPALMFDPGPQIAVVSYGVAVMNGTGKVVTATMGLEVKPGQLIAIPLDYASLPPGDYTVAVRARRVDGSILILKTFQIRNQAR